VRAFSLSLTVFLITIWLAAYLYPGGTWFDRTSPGFSFWGNFWCDLLHERSFNHQPNTPSLWLARAAFWAFSVALFRFWPLAARLIEGRSLQRWIVALGLCGALTLLLVTMFSSRSEPALHGVFVVASALLGVIAASVLSLALFARADALTRALSLGLIGSALLSLAQYVSQGFGADAAEWLAGAQKITTLFLLAFMLRCIVLLKRRALVEARGSAREQLVDGAPRGAA
jgi:multisubunit Na+/H+ antiporter MnhF subunit